MSALDHNTGIEVLDLHSNTAFLARPSHLRDTAAQLKGMQRLAHVFADTPDKVLQELSNVVVELCGADSATAAAKRFAAAGQSIYAIQTSPLTGGRLAAVNTALRDAETALLIKEGLPHRTWYKHAIFDPGEYTGYAAVTIPGVTEGLDANDPTRTQQQLAVLATALNNAATILESASK